VLAKFPRPGAVKTRLAAEIGAGPACALYRAFIRDLALRLRGIGRPVAWAYAPGGAPFGRLVGSRRCFAQRGADLGARIRHALARVRRDGAGAAVALGADAPHVPLAEVRRAVRALERGVDLVLGPARDGGYYLIGVRTPHTALFRDVPWSSDRVLAVTRRRARALGLAVLELRPSFDVDRAADLPALARAVRRAPQAFPHTGRALRRLRDRGGAQSPRRIASA
jgi:hypothetical protein